MSSALQHHEDWPLLLSLLLLVVLLCAAGLLLTEPSPSPGFDPGRSLLEMHSLPAPATELEEHDPATPSTQPSYQRSSSTAPQDTSMIDVEQALQQPRVGKVVDESGKVVSGIALTTSSRREKVLATSGTDGCFELPELDDHSLVVPASQGYLALASFRLRNPGREPLVVVTRARALHGQITTRSGQPLDGMRLDLTPVTPLLEFPAATKLWRSATNVQGEFEFPAVPASLPFRLRALATGHEPQQWQIETGQDDLMLQLDSNDEPRSIFGQVLNVAGLPVTGSVLSMGSARAFSDPQGRFVLQVSPQQHNLPLIASHRDHGIATCTKVTSQNLELRLTLPATAIAGRVLDSRQQALRGWRISVLQEEETNPSTSGGRVVDSAKGPYWEWLAAESDVEGRYRLCGPLPHRQYYLQAHHADQALTVIAGPFVVGSIQANIIVEAGLHRSPLCGRVESSNGSPLTGVLIVVQSTLELKGIEFLGPRTCLTRTGVDGRFALDPLPRGTLRLTLQAPRYQERTWVLDDRFSSDSLHFTLDALAALHAHPGA